MSKLIEALKDWAPLLSIMISGATAWAAWSLRQLAKTEVQATVATSEGKLQAQIDLAAGELREHDTQLTKIEARLEDIPTKSDLTRLEGAVNEVRSAVALAQSGIGRLEGYFLNRGVDRV